MRNTLGVTTNLLNLRDMGGGGCWLKVFFPWKWLIHLDMLVPFFKCGSQLGEGFHVQKWQAKGEL